MASLIHRLQTYWRQQAIKHPIIPSKRWQQTITQLPLLQNLTPAELSRLRELSTLFLHAKSIYGAQGFKVTEKMRLVVAVQATLPILGLDLGDYKGWHAVVLYPGPFIAKYTERDASGVVHFIQRQLIGESWERGPVILSWNEVAQALSPHPQHRNVVIHELAHKLDLGNGIANGMPPLHWTMRRHTWTTVFSQAYKDLRHRWAASESLPIDPYGLKSPAEFFAVASEEFFVSPQKLQAALPQIYRELQLYYRQDPASRCHSAAGRF